LSIEWGPAKAGIPDVGLKGVARIWCGICAVVLLLCALAHEAQGQTVTARSLAQEFDGLALTATAGNDKAAQKAGYDAVRILDRIRQEFPTSLEARLLQSKGRLPNRAVNLEVIYARAEEWAKATPDAQTMLPAALAIGLGDDATVPDDAVELDVAPAISLAAPLLPDTNATALLPGAAVAPDTGAPHPAMSEAELHRKLRTASVLLFFVGSKKTGGLKAFHVGSGSLVAPDIVLTNAHVAEEMASYSGTWLAINDTIGIRQAKVVSIARRETPFKIDAAVMQLQGYKAPEYLTLNTAPQLDERILIAGYPGDATLLDQRYVTLQTLLEQGKIPQKSQLPTALLNEGRINNFIDYSGNNTTELQYTMVTAPGNSGSPIVNVCGEIVGLHYSGGARGAEVKFNGAVHARDVVQFLRSVGVAAQATSGACVDRN
jgi:S1-C subfamily serine protease